MIHFRNDYSAGAHPSVLDALTRTNLELTAGYGCDPYCEAAANTIRKLCNAPHAEVHFLVGGTQVNKPARLKITVTKSSTALPPTAR